MINPFPHTANNFESMFAHTRKISINEGTIMETSWKHFGKWRNCSFWAISPFANMFSKSRLLQRRQKVSIWAKRVSTVNKICSKWLWKSLGNNLENLLKWKYNYWVYIELKTCCKKTNFSYWAIYLFYIVSNSCLLQEDQKVSIVYVGNCFKTHIDFVMISNDYLYRTQ